MVNNSEKIRRFVLHSINGYDEKHDALLQSLIDEKYLLFCVVGKDCELWHDIMDELIVGDGSIELDFDMITTWHADENFNEVLIFAEMFDLGSEVSEAIKVIEL